MGRQMKRRQGRIETAVAASLLALLVVSCDLEKKEDPRKSSIATIGTNKQSFDVRGVIVTLDPAQKSARIKHETIPNYMPAMTMDFDVKDTNELTGLKPGDAVSFRMTVTSSAGWIDHIQKRDPEPIQGPPTTGPFRLVRDVDLLNPGDLLPNYVFTNQFGKAFHTSDYKGSALAITFLFTRCPYPTFCPLMSDNFAKAQDALLSMNSGPTNWHLLTISFDPEFDTPAVLRSYAELHKNKPDHWTFATGALIDITAIGDQFGLTFTHDQTGGISHNLRTAVIDASGRVQRIFNGNSWTVEDLVKEIAKAAKQ